MDPAQCKQSGESNEINVMHGAIHPVDAAGRRGARGRLIDLT